MSKGDSYGISSESCSSKFIMQYFEHRAITSAVNPSRLWKRYVDDTFVILQQSQKEVFLLHINSVDPSIKFTTDPMQWFHTIPGHTDYTTRR